jgi:peptide/nickel transport system substrate-binding protein
MAAQAQADGHDVISLASPAGSMAAMNAGATVTCKGGAPAICVGKADGDKVPSVTATANPAVRQAVANAIDPKVINQRVFEGKALPDSAPFANSAFDPGVKKPLYDADLAKKEVSAAKAAGWDGKIRVLTPNTPQDSAWGEAVSAMLTAAGMEVAVDSTQDQAAVINQVLVQKNFDIVTWSYGFVDEPPGTYLQMVASFTGLYGYNNPEMVAAVDSLRTADTPEKKKDSFNKISELWFRDNPSAVFTISKNGFIVGSKLHGVQRGAYAKVWFDKAWLSQ